MHGAKVGGGGGEEPVKSYEMCPLNNQRPNQFVQRPRRSGRTTEECVEWAAARRIQVHISDKHNSRRERLSAAKDGQEGWD